MERVTFSRNGKTIRGLVLSKDTDPRVAMWVIDAIDPDVSYLVMPNELVK